MPKHTPYANSRKAARWQCDYIPVTWENGDRNRRRPGSLSDISEIGLAYLTARSGVPNPGDSVTVTPKGTTSRLNCRVVRVNQFSEGLFMVGCERMDGVESAIQTDPAPKRDRVSIRPKPRQRMTMAA